MAKIFLATRNGLAFIVSDVRFGNSLLKEPEKISSLFQSGLPDGIFFNQKSQYRYTYFEEPWNGKCPYILWPFGSFYGHLVYFMVIWYIFHRFGVLYKEKSGNTGFKGKLFLRFRMRKNN
jgi:hypothetical protein